MRRWIILVLLLTTCGATLWWVAAQYEQQRRIEADIQAPSIGDEDDPYARYTYEMRRLRSPRTGQIPEGIRARELAYARQLPTVAQLQGLGKRAGGAVGNWTPRGPTNQGGRTRALDYDVTNPSILLAGGASGGIWRSNDGGLSWTKRTDPGQLHSVTSVTQDTRAGYTGTWYYGTGEWRGGLSGVGFTDYRGDGIFRSTDGGLTWTQLPATVSDTPESTDSDFDFVWNVVTDPTAQGATTVLAATAGGIHRSTDGGDTWNRVLGTGVDVPNDVVYYTDLVVTLNGVFYAALHEPGGALGGNLGIYRSPDGVTWTDITPNWPPDWESRWRRTVLTLAPSDETQLYVLSTTTDESNFLWHYTYQSGDGSGAGGSWSNRSANLPSGTEYHTAFDTQRGYNMVAAVDPSDANTVLLGVVNLFRSTDGFTSTANTTLIGGAHPDGTGTNGTVDFYPNHHPDQHALVYLPNGSLLSGHDGGVSITTDPGAATVNWSFRNAGYATTQFYTIALDNATPGDEQLIGGLQDNGSLFGNSASTQWASILGADGGVAAIADGGTAFYPSTQGGRLRRMQLDGAGNITNYARAHPCLNNALFVAPFALDPTDTQRIYLADGLTIWRNNDLTQIPWNNTDCLSDNAAGWQLLDNTGRQPGFISALTIARSEQRMYYGTTTGRLYRVPVQPSLDAHETEITSPTFPADAYISSIAVDPRNADNVLVAFSNYEVPSLFYTLDGGSTWFDVSGNLEENEDGTGSGPAVNWVDLLVDGDEVTYFAATSTGLYSATSLVAGSTVWAQEGASTIGTVPVSMVRARQLHEANDGFVAVGTYGNGVFSTFYPTGKRVAGTIRDADGTPIEGVVLDGLPGTPSTDAHGNYSATIDWEWTGTVTPTKAGYAFSPASIVYDAVPAESRPYDDFLAVPDAGPRVPTVGLDLWWKESGLHGLATLGSDPEIFRWDDASGNGRDLVQLSTSRRPLYAPNGVRGYPAVRFDGTDDLLTHSGYSLDSRDEGTVFAVMRTDNSQGGRYLFSMPKDVTGLNGFDLGFTSTRVRSNLKTINGFTTAEAVENYYDGDGHILTGRYWADGILATHRVYYDGGQEDAENTSGTIEAGANRVYLGGFSASYSAYYSGELAEVLVYNRSLGIAERTAVENYLGLKFGIGRRTVADPSISGGLEGVLVLGSIGAAVNLTDGPSQSGSLSSTTGTSPSVIGSLPSGVGAILPDQYWSIDAFLSDYAYSITFDLRDFDLGGVAFGDLTALKRDDGSSPWYDVRSLSGITLVHHEPYLTASGLTAFSDFAIGVTDGAAGLLVTTEDDIVDANAGNCSTMQPADLPGADGVTSLREAICATNNDVPRTVTLPAGTYALSIAGTGEDGNATGDLDLGPGVTLDGAGARSTIIAANGLDRVLDVRGANVVIDGVTITAGQASDDGYAGQYGGGIRVANIDSDDASLQLINSLVSGNTAGSGSGLAFAGGGGGIACAQYTTLEVIGSTIVYNASGDGDTPGNGGGVFLTANTTATFTNSTISNNTTGTGTSGRGNGGGLYASSGADVSLQHVTIAANDAREGGGLYRTGSSTVVTLANTLVADNAADGQNPDCYGSFVSGDYNLVEVMNATYCKFSNGTSTDIIGQDSQLGMLQNNGGPTDTHLPGFSGAGIDVIPVGLADCGTSGQVDQRGRQRPTDSDDDGTAACDIGATEPTYAEIAPPVTDLAVSTFLEGPMQSLQMAVGLSDYLPETDPYFGTQNVPSGYFTSDPDGQRVVDWVVLQLRTGDPASPPMTVAAERAALLLDDGTVLDSDGSPTVQMDGGPGSYYVVVGHRNHLWAMSDVAVDCSGGSCGFDFTAGTAYGTNALKDLGGGMYGLYAGDADGDGLVDGSDKVAWLGVRGSPAGYYEADINTDGLVDGSDKVAWLSSRGAATAVPEGAASATPAPLQATSWTQPSGGGVQRQSSSLKRR